MYRYIGNKTKLLSEVMSSVGELVKPGSTVVDLMAGTGVVSAELRKAGYRVIAADLMTYSKCHLDTLLRLDAYPDFTGLREKGLISAVGQDAYGEVLDLLNGLEPVDGYFFREFSPDGRPANGSPSRKYFTSQNAKKIDSIRIVIGYWSKQSLITPIEESLLRHTLIMAANEVASISGTYGYFLARFGRGALEPVVLKPAALIASGKTDNVVLQGYAEELAKGITADCCYIDPPYMKRQYAANYHILETLARGDEPIAEGKSGLRPWRDQYSNLCTKTRGKDSFRAIFSNMDCPYFLVSYSEDGLFSLEELVELFSEFGSVTVKAIPYNRFRSNNSPLGKKLEEYIICLRKGVEGSEVSYGGIC